MDMTEEELACRKKVMIAIDESECSHYALKWVLDNLHDSLSTSSLIIFTVQSIADFSYLPAASPGSARMFCPPSTNIELIKSVQEHQKKVALALLEKAKGICASQGVIAETITEVGDPKEAICHAVDNLNIDLLILGSHGRGALKSPRECEQLLCS
ncbi:PREDICTED: universal stress protein A-like protein isoform X2 [Nelumbo nucifera]|uniref:Universal stress protein A-like protein isoform X2 n=1 Tax=Nelumbo nucifera TaxID=4432 RepID=A0A1U8ADT7_NELNU|nr:PREDICTED: universal stress protein A-like protein isoform X2 [Nelumbo nucifera]